MPATPASGTNHTLSWGATNGSLPAARRASWSCLGTARRRGSKGSRGSRGSRQWALVPFNSSCLFILFSSQPFPGHLDVPGQDDGVGCRAADAPRAILNGVKDLGLPHAETARSFTGALDATPLWHGAAAPDRDRGSTTSGRGHVPRHATILARVCPGGRPKDTPRMSVSTTMPRNRPLVCRASCVRGAIRRTTPAGARPEIAISAMNGSACQRGMLMVTTISGVRRSVCADE